MKMKILVLCSLLFFAFSLKANDVTGFWQTIDKKTKLPTSVIAVYAYNGKYYGKIVATCNKQGIVSETLYHPESKAPGVMGNPYYCGLDIIWACSPEGDGVFKGHVIDPREGKRYQAKIWRENENLILRGEVLMFGRNEVLVKFPPSKFNNFFEQPNLNALIPAAYRLKH